MILNLIMITLPDANRSNKFWRWRHATNWITWIWPRHYYQISVF